jgi:hypothetical protein
MVHSGSYPENPLFLDSAEWGVGIRCAEVVAQDDIRSPNTIVNDMSDRRLGDFFISK